MVNHPTVSPQMLIPSFARQSNYIRANRETKRARPQATQGRAGQSPPLLVDGERRAIVVAQFNGFREMGIDQRIVRRIAHNAHRI